MITLEEASNILKRDFPESKISITNKTNLEVFTTLAAITESEIQKGHFEKVKQIFQSIYLLFIQAELPLKIAIENCYLYSLNLQGIAFESLIGLMSDDRRTKYLSIVNPQISN